MSKVDSSLLDKVFTPSAKSGSTEGHAALGAGVTVTMVRTSKVGVKVGIVGSDVIVPVGRGVFDRAILGEGDVVGDGLLGVALWETSTVWVAVATGAAQAVRSKANKKREKTFGIGKLAPNQYPP